MKRLLKRLSLKTLLIQIIIFFIFGEIATRIFYPLPAYNPKTIHYGTILPDEELGWLY
jgi:hypothetical protein